MFGDSIAARVQRDLATQLATKGVTPLAVETCGGRNTAGCVDALTRWAATTGTLPTRGVLMLCGTNDIFDPPALPDQIDRAMALVGPDVPVFWRDVQACRTNKTAAVQLADQRNTAWVNQLLYDAKRRHPNLTVIPWFSWFSTTPARMAMYLEDGVHPNDKGIPFHNAVVIPALGLP